MIRVALATLMTGLLAVGAGAGPVRKSNSDPLDRVKLEGLAVTLQIKEIQTDLGLSDEQVKELDKARATMKDQIQKGIMNAAPPPALPAPGGAGGVVVGTAISLDDFMSGPLAAFDKAAVAILKPEQARRLRQLTLQIQGPNALLDRRVIRLLDLSAEQEDEIDAVLPKLAFGDPEKVAKSSDKALADAMKTLTDDQKSKWETLIGTRLSTPVLLKASPMYGNIFEDVQVFGGVAAPAIPAAPAPPPPKPE